MPSPTNPVNCKQSPCAVAGEWFTAHGTAVLLGAFCREENACPAQKLRDVFAAWIDSGHSDLTDEYTCILRISLPDGVLFSRGERFELTFA